MNCTTARAATSALLDREPAGVDTAALADHLEACPACREWRERAHELTRRLRIQPGPPPAMAEGAARLAAVLAEEAPRSRLGTGRLERAGLLAVGLCQLAASVPMLVFGDDHQAPVHVAHEMGSFEAAVGLGFLAAAWRPARAPGMRVVLGAAALLLVLTALVDLLAGRTTLADEAPHLLVLAGWLLLGRLDPGEPPLGARRPWRRALPASLVRPVATRLLAKRDPADEGGAREIGRRATEGRATEGRAAS